MFIVDVEHLTGSEYYRRKQCMPSLLRYGYGSETFDGRLNLGGIAWIKKKMRCTE